MTISRRSFAKLAASALPISALPISALPAAAAPIDSKIHGVEIGAQTYSFRDLPLDGAIDAMQRIGIGQCELYYGHVEPKGLTGAALKKWRLETPLDYFTAIRARFKDAGIKIFAYTFGFRDNLSDEEIDRAFDQTKALGTDVITTSTTLTCAKRIVPFVEKHRVRVALHGHDQIEKPNEVSSPDTFAKGLAMSKMYYINLDIGHFVAAGFDPVPYLQEHHAKILVLHLKDRKKSHGDNVPWGEGETPIKPVLQLLRDKKWPIPADIEYEYGKEGMDTVAEVRKCFEFCKQALA
jgi:sugar phosphate isomerase/epimerase